jgi:hypothetical protein
MEPLIRSYISSKKPRVIHNLLVDVLSEIGEKHSIDKEELFETCMHFMSDKACKSQCEGIMKSGVRCVCPAIPHESYCRRHLACKSPALERPRCIGVTNKGEQCLSDALHSGSGYCKIHDRKRQNDALRLPCVYYDEQDDELDFCENTTVLGKWTCKRHAHLERNQTSLYRYPNLHAYKNRPSHEPSISVLESLLENVL